MVYNAIRYKSYCDVGSSGGSYIGNSKYIGEKSVTGLFSKFYIEKTQNDID